MAKKQTFTSKLSKQGSNFKHIKHIKSVVSEDTGHVKFLENLPQTKIKELLNESKLLIHSSQFETFGLVAIEANSMGVPVLSTNSGSFPEIIFNGVNGYLADNLVDGNVNNYVRDLLRDNKTFEEAMFNCIEKSINYDWKITARDIEEIYRIIV